MSHSLSQVRTAWESHVTGGNPSSEAHTAAVLERSWPQEVFNDYIVVRSPDGLSRVNYVVGEDGKITFGEEKPCRVEYITLSGMSLSERIELSMNSNLAQTVDNKLCVVELSETAEGEDGGGETADTEEPREADSAGAEQSGDGDSKSTDSTDESAADDKDETEPEADGEDSREDRLREEVARLIAILKDKGL